MLRSPKEAANGTPLSDTNDLPEGDRKFLDLVLELDILKISHKREFASARRRRARRAAAVTETLAQKPDVDTPLCLCAGTILSRRCCSSVLVASRRIDRGPERHSRVQLPVAARRERGEGCRTTTT